MVNEVEGKLEEETEKWLERIEEEEARGKGEKANLFLKNIRAYTEDSEYFLEEGELVKAFEAVVWAWSWLEIGQELDILK
ncbi:MAG: DUF357 domain-containing protein [Candidatus Aenigmatarchaeota archaeon]